MRTVVFFALALTTAPAWAGTTPDADQMRLITDALANAVPAENQLRLSDVVVGEDRSDSGQFVCGNIQTRSKDAARPDLTPFMGMLAKGNTTGAPMFVLVTIAKPDAASKSAVLEACLDRL